MLREPMEGKEESQQWLKMKSSPSTVFSVGIPTAMPVACRTTRRPTTRLYPCSLCPKLLPNLLSLKNHGRTHTDPKRHFCGKAFRTAAQLEGHGHVHAPQEGPFSCPQCPRHFGQATFLPHQQQHQEAWTEPQKHQRQADGTCHYPLSPHSWTLYPSGLQTSASPSEVQVSKDHNTG
ncbi:hypothetical protein MC885_018954 [Smutsia gigantea]|nr:hypothetical protein MC885_018954 [Smutsia gigantea]